MVGAFARLLLVNALPPALFDTRTDATHLRHLFSQYVKLVEIENHGYCNRTCWFCPNSFIDRRSSRSPISDSLYESILADLASIGFSATLVWARYHEPLAHESIHANLLKARKALPRAFLTMHTNGDYLDKNIIERLVQEGLNQLRINLYVPESQAYGEEAVRALLASLEHRTGHKVQRDVAAGLVLAHGRLHMPISVPDFRSGMSSRGGVLDAAKRDVEFVRTSVCLSPLQHLVIDYNGKGMLCCQVRSDVPEHQSAIIGDLGRAGYSLFDLYRDLAAARRDLMAPGRKSGVCATCTMNNGGPYRLGRHLLVSRLITAIPGEKALVGTLWKRRPRRYDPG